MKLSWEEWYKLAFKYYEENNHLAVPNSYVTKDGFYLGRWIERQRMLYKKDTLSLVQVKLLKDIDMIFDMKENRRKSIILCELFSIDYKKYSFLKNIPYEILNSKVNFLLDNRYSVLCGSFPDQIFYMTDKEMLQDFGISKQNLCEGYYKEAEGGINYVFKEKRSK